MYRASALVLALLLAATSCRRTDHAANFDAVVNDFVFGSLNLYPSLATSSGYHEHAGVILDEALEDFSPNGLQAQRAFYNGIRSRLRRIPRESLSAQALADRAIIEDQVELALLDLGRIESFRHNPTLYVETIGNALFSPLILDYAPKPNRIGHIIARLNKIPRFIAVARENLTDSPDVWRTTAIEENEGNMELINKEIRAEVPASMRETYDRAAEMALIALRDFNGWLGKEFARRQSDWRLGEPFAAKLKSTLGTSMKPDQVLADAEQMLGDTRRQMLALALKLNPKGNPNDLNATVAEALRAVAKKHATVDTYFADARRDLEEARQFVKQKGLLTLPPRDNLQVIETPEFMRGIYAVGGFASAPALQPHLGAFYWLTPIPKTWPAARIESKLREYNFYGLKLLTIHEAMPGHYVQLEYANNVEPAGRRALRSVFGNGPYVEGWAVYATEMMLDEGYLDNSPELRLTFLKQQLRMIANAILDVRMHMHNMKDEDAMRLMTVDTFQEEEEATAKLRRAKLSSTQLSTYFVGYREWVKLRKAVEARQGGNFRLAEFHEKALRTGAVPMRTMEALLQ
jgi:uncharacterized protein (DUF885 family)